MSMLKVKGGTEIYYNREGAEVSPGMCDNWWGQGILGGIKAHYDRIRAFSKN